MSLNIEGYVPAEIGDNYTYQEALGWLRIAIDHHLSDALALRLTSLHLKRVGGLWEFSYVLEERPIIPYAGVDNREMKHWGARIANSGPRGSGPPKGAKATRIKQKGVTSGGS